MDAKKVKEIIIEDCGPNWKGTQQTILGAPKYIRILIVGQGGETEEAFRGTEFREEQ